jgi:hypothetical protein
MTDKSELLARKLNARFFALRPGEPLTADDLKLIGEAHEALSPTPALPAERVKALEEAADIAEAIDSGRGNESEIARAIRARAALTTPIALKLISCACAEVAGEEPSCPVHGAPLADEARLPCCTVRGTKEEQIAALTKWVRDALRFIDLWDSGEGNDHPDLDDERLKREGFALFGAVIDFDQWCLDDLDYRSLTVFLPTPSTAPAADDHAELQLIVERDQAEDALSRAYALVTGRPAEWSNHFGFAEALDEIADAVAPEAAPVADKEAAEQIVDRIIQRVETVSIPDNDGSGTTRLFVRIDHVAGAVRQALASTTEGGLREALDDEEIEDAAGRLRGWLQAGEDHAQRGGKLLPLDVDVAIMLDELEWRRDPEAAAEEEIERRSDETVRSAIESALRTDQRVLGDGVLGRDIRTVAVALAASPSNGQTEGGR